MFLKCPGAPSESIQSFLFFFKLALMLLQYCLYIKAAAVYLAETQARTAREVEEHKAKMTALDKLKAEAPDKYAAQAKKENDALNVALKDASPTSASVPVTAVSELSDSNSSPELSVDKISNVADTRTRQRSVSFQLSNGHVVFPGSEEEAPKIEDASKNNKTAKKAKRNQRFEQTCMPISCDTRK